MLPRSIRSRPPGPGRRRLQPIVGPRVDGVHAHPDARGRRPAPKLVSPEVVTREPVIETTGKVQFNEEALGACTHRSPAASSRCSRAPGDTVEAGQPAVRAR